MGQFYFFRNFYQILFICSLNHHIYDGEDDHFDYDNNENKTEKSKILWNLLVLLKIKHFIVEVPLQVS